MIHFFENQAKTVYAVQTQAQLNQADIKKLNWINSQYIKSFSVNKLVSLPAFKNVSENALPLITERLEKLSDVQNFDYFWKEPIYDPNLLKWKKFSLEDSRKTLEKVQELLLKSDFNKDEIRKKLDELGKEVGDRGLVYWPLRVALTGKEKSPDPMDIVFVLEKEKVLSRINDAIKKSE